MKIQKLLSDYILKIREVDRLGTEYSTKQKALHKLIANFIEDIYKLIPEVKYYQGDAKATVEAQVSSGSKQFYGKQRTVEELRAVNGVVCYLLVLSGTKIAHRAFISGQNDDVALPFISEFGSERENFKNKSISFSSWHNFVREKWKLLDHAAMLYAALINDLGKTIIFRMLYRTLNNNQLPRDHDEALAKILQAFLSKQQDKIFQEVGINFQGLLSLPVEKQQMILECFAQSCTNSEIQQCETTNQRIKDLEKSSLAVRKFHFGMEYLGDVPGARLPKDGSATSLTMHKNTLHHIYLLWDAFFSISKESDKRSTIESYESYKRQRLIQVGIYNSPKVITEADKTPVSALNSVLALAIGATRTADASRAKIIYNVVANMPKMEIDIIAKGLNNIYMLNIVSLINNPIYKTGDLQKGLRIGLSLVAYLYQKGAQFLLSKGNEVNINTLNATEVAKVLGYHPKKSATKEDILAAANVMINNKGVIPASIIFAAAFKKVIYLDNSAARINFNVKDLQPLLQLSSATKGNGSGLATKNSLFATMQSSLPAMQSASGIKIPSLAANHHHELTYTDFAKDILINSASGALLMFSGAKIYKNVTKKTDCSYNVSYEAAAAILGMLAGGALGAHKFISRM